MKLDPRFPASWPEVVFVGDLNRATLSRAAKEGRAMRLGPGIYTARLRTPADELVLRNWRRIANHVVPGAVITDRSFLAAGPVDGRLTVVHRRQEPFELPGLTIAPRPGPAALPGDQPLDTLFVASDARALLENLRGHHHRYLSDVEVERWIADRLLIPSGGQRLAFVRDEARRIADALGWQEAFARLDAIIAAGSGTGDADDVVTPALVARARGRAYDQARIGLFERFGEHLERVQPRSLPDPPDLASRRALLPFYEAYFSNYIEGTEFTLDEAAEIVFAGADLARPADAHDISATYELVSDAAGRARRPRDADDFLSLALARHARLMAERPDNRPGRWKTMANRAGGTSFVAPTLVEATLGRAFEVGAGLLDPFARAAYLHFVVTEVHPFVDGNGRMSRIFMNAELSGAGQVRIVIPTVYRNNYIFALRGASHADAFDALVAMLDFAWRWTARIDFTDRAAAEADLSRTEALRDPGEAESYGIRLRLPG